MSSVLTVHVLGPVEVHRDGVAVDLGGPQQRAVIAHLALDVGRVVSVERLIDRLWGDEPPRTPLGTLQSYVSRLRRTVEPAREAGAAPQVLVSEAPGYVLRLPPEAVDVHRFTAIVNDARSAAAAGYASQALEHFDAALDLWRGPALAGVGPDEEVRPIVVRFEEERAQAIEDRFETLLALGRHGEAIPALQHAVDEHPLRERLWALLALALYRSSRQADALRALSTARAALLDELGLDPGPELRTLENRILAQDPGLLATPDVVAPKVVVAEPTPARAPSSSGARDEWGVLTGALQAAPGGGAQVVLVEGEPGIGKSTLSDAFLAHARSLGWRTAVGHCVESGLAPSLWPAIEILRTLIAETSPVPESAARNVLYQFVTSEEPTRLSLSPVELADQFVALVDVLELGARRDVGRRPALGRQGDARRDHIGRRTPGFAAGRRGRCVSAARDRARLVAWRRPRPSGAGGDRHTRVDVAVEHRRRGAAHGDHDRYRSLGRDRGSGPGPRRWQPTVRRRTGAARRRARRHRRAGRTGRDPRRRAQPARPAPRQFDARAAGRGDAR